jgi:hypothetical protein
MSIVARPKSNAAPEAAVQAFIGSAPDAAAAASVAVPRRGSTLQKTQISLKLAPELLARLDVVARANGLSRASAINVAVARYIEQGT